MNTRTFWQLPAGMCSNEVYAWLQTFAHNVQIEDPVTTDLQVMTGRQVKVTLKASQVTFFTSHPEHDTMLRLRFGEGIYCIGVDAWEW